MTAMAVQHAPGRFWRSIVIPLHRGEWWIDATLRSVAAEADNVLEVTALGSSPDGITLDIARRYSDRLRANFAVAIATLTVTSSRILNGFNLQLKTALTRHMPKLDLQARAVDHAACTSIVVYATLAAAALGNLRYLSGVWAELLRLEPGGLGRHVHHSQIVERVTLRLRPRLYGAY